MTEPAYVKVQNDLRELAEAAHPDTFRDLSFVMGDEQAYTALWWCWCSCALREDRIARIQAIHGLVLALDGEGYWGIRETVRELAMRPAPVQLQSLQSSQE